MLGIVVPNSFADSYWDNSVTAMQQMAVLFLCLSPVARENVRREEANTRSGFCSSP